MTIRISGANLRNGGLCQLVEVLPQRYFFSLFAHRPFPARFNRQFPSRHSSFERDGTEERLQDFFPWSQAMSETQVYYSSSTDLERLVLHAIPKTQ